LLRLDFQPVGFKDTLALDINIVLAALQPMSLSGADEKLCGSLRKLNPIGYPGPVKTHTRSNWQV
jgi:hypothetical protein